MKRILILLLVVLTATIGYSQEEKFRAEVNLFKEKLNLSDAQQKEVSKIVLKKYNELQSISKLRSQDESLFRKKRRSIYELTEGSVRLVLAKDQLELWEDYRAERRMKNALLIRKLQSENASKEDIKDAQAGIEN